MLSITHAIDAFGAAHPAIRFSLGFALLIFVITNLISFMGGWWSLAERYRTEKRMPASLFLLSGTFRYVATYNNVIVAGSDADGIYLLFWPRLAHPRLFIPWSDIRFKKPFGLIFKSQTMLLGTNPAVPFSVSQRKVERLTKYRPATPASAPPPTVDSTPIE